MELIQNYTLSIISVLKEFNYKELERNIKEIIINNCRLRECTDVSVAVIDRFKCNVIFKTTHNDNLNLYSKILRIIKITNGMENLRNYTFSNPVVSIAIMKMAHNLINPNNVKFSILIRCKDKNPDYDYKSIIGFCKGVSFRERLGTMKDFAIVNKEDKNQIIIYCDCLYTVSRLYDLLTKCTSEHYDCFINHTISKM